MGKTRLFFSTRKVFGFLQKTSKSDMVFCGFLHHAAWVVILVLQCLQTLDLARFGSGASVNISQTEICFRPVCLLTRLEGGREPASLKSVLVLTSCKSSRKSDSTRSDTSAIDVKVGLIGT